MDPAHFDPPPPDPPPPDVQADPDPPVETVAEEQLRDVGRATFGLKYGDDRASEVMTTAASTAKARRHCFTWVTWLSPLLSGDASCWWSAWFKSHFQDYAKVSHDSFDLDTWKVQHTEMVQLRAEQLRADGWTVTVEDQNKFMLRGKVGTLSGKPDIVADKGELVFIEDCKGGKRKTSDRLQVLEYMFALPLVQSDRCAGKRVSGRVIYRDGWIEVPADQFTPDLRQNVIDAMLRVSGPTPPEVVPSAAECRFCEISTADCPARIDAPTEVVTTEDF
jgi:hypothetical protein